MKKIFFLILFIYLFTLMAYAENTNEKHDAMLMTDSYHYGLSGSDCSDIYNDSETSKWKLQSSDPGALDKVHERCKDGEKDFLKGKKELPHILDKINNNH